MVVPNLYTKREANGKAYIGDPPDEGGVSDYWAENEACRLQIERTDSDEIRLGVMLGRDDTEAAGVYLTRHEALRVLLSLAAVIGEY